MLIAIDTSTNFACVGVATEDTVLAELNWRCGQNHTTQLLPALSFLLQQQGMDIKAATGVIVAKGPGSYNGLRVGLSTVKGLSFSLGVPVVSVGTMEVEAYPHADRGLPVCVVFNAGRGEIATATFQQTREGWVRLAAERVTTLQELCSTIAVPTIFCGEYISAIAPTVREALGIRAHFVSPAAGQRRAAYLIELGAKRLKARDYDDPATLQPMYLRGPAITEPKRREPQTKGER